MDLSGLLNGAEHYDYDGDGDASAIDVDPPHLQSDAASIISAPPSPSAASTVPPSPAQRQQQQQHAESTAASFSATPPVYEPPSSPSIRSTANNTPAVELPITATTIVPSDHAAASALSASSSSRPIASIPAGSSSLHPPPPPRSAGKKTATRRKKPTPSTASATATATSANSQAATASAADTLALLASQAPTTAGAALQALNQQQQQPTPLPQSSNTLPVPPPHLVKDTAATPQHHQDPGYVDPDWIENTQAVIAEADAELPNHPHIINPYIAKHQVQQAHLRNLNLHQYSSSTTSSLINSANEITQWSAACLSLIMDSEILGEEKVLKLAPGESVEDPSNTSSHAGPSNATEGTADDAINVSTAASSSIATATTGGAGAIVQITAEQEEAERIEKLEKKKASAREGWKKRRQNALEEREKLAILEAEALGLNEEDTQAHIANAIASLNTSTSSTRGARAGSARGDASSPAPSNASGAAPPKRRRRAPKAQAAQAAAEATPLPGSLTHETVVSSFAMENGSMSVDADGQSQNGDNNASVNNRKRAASTESSSNATLTANDAKRPRLAEDGTNSAALLPSDAGLSPNVKIEYSDVNMDSGSPFPQPHTHLAQNGISTSFLPPHLRSSPGLESDRQVSPALSNTDSARGKRESQQPLSSSTGGVKEKLTGPALVEAERKIWATIARSNIPKVIKYQQQGLTSRQLFNKRLAGAAAREGRKYNTKHPKAPKDVQIKARRVMRELLLHLKGNEKLVRENKRKQEKELLDKAKKEEEQREAQRQARKLNFLITQTELYSHFVGSKLQTDEMEESAETAGSSTSKKPITATAELAASLDKDALPSKADLTAIDFDDEKNLLDHARANAQAALEATRNKTKIFDDSYHQEQRTAKENYIVGDNEDEDGESGKPDPSLAKVNLDELNFQNPQMAGDVEILKQPTMLTCQLKDYQLKGLNWLANLYEQGINGILADEMGLGKTVQSISLMAYLAEHHNIWGPFLVVAPASTLHNWQQELTKFAPALKVLPYWGNVKDRTILRKFWNRKSLRYDQNAPFHVLITSYQLIVTDEQYFGKVKWQYMVLDEAQAIKSSASARWKILLGLNCRNRLLLTGTPIQNSMQELWALLHFIMPSLFDSHNEFSDWFSKDIEGNADKSGGMNEHQLRRLHMILKPFMLRRIKKNVQNELADKIEIDLYCDLTPRQRQMYRTLRQNISIADLVKRASSLSDDDSVKRLMNLIMQFRKVCNHPELFERADVEAPFAFCQFPQNYNLSREGNFLNVQYSTHSLLEVRVPRLLYDDSPKLDFSDTSYLSSLMNIYTSRNMSPFVNDKDPAFDFEAFSGLSPRALRTLARSDNPVERLAVAEEDKENSRVATTQDKVSGLPSRSLSLRGRRTIPNDPSWHYLGLPPLGRIQEQYRDYSRFNRSDMRFYIDPAQAPPPELFSSSRSFAYKQSDMRFDENVRTALYGVPGESTGVVGALNKSQLPLAPMEVPQLHKLILDSGKLAKLDELLTQLKAGGHRVLVYFQMTRMIDLMEEYLAFRQYKYLRLDGSSTISERRDMVTDWQTKPEIFIFLLSTRAGGLGINLTAADTVVFYDSDWNPSNDVQAMDRAHRLGQTRQVTVYRLITKGTIDERIVQLARAKKSVQDAVVGSSTQTVGAGATDQINSNEVVNLLLDDDELEETMRQKEANRLQQELKSIDNGKKGAKAREENRRAKEIAANAKASGFNSSNGWGGADDDDDAFGFFSNVPSKKYKDPDEDTEGMGGGVDENGTSTPAGASNGTNGKAKPAKGKGSRIKKTNPDDPNAPPAKKRKPAVKKEPAEAKMEVDGGTDGDASNKKKGVGGGWPKGKPRGKKLGNEPTSGSFNPGAPALVSAAPSTAADSSAAPTPSSSNT